VSTLAVINKEILKFNIFFPAYIEKKEKNCHPVSNYVNWMHEHWMCYFLRYMQLLCFENRMCIIETPGVREFSLLEMLPMKMLKNLK
jgi:hypothetical protein